MTDKQIRDRIVGALSVSMMPMELEAECVAFLDRCLAADKNVGVKWIPVTEQVPDNFVSVLGFMTDAGPFPAVRECYSVGDNFFFPALEECHPVSHWKPLPEPPKEVQE